MLDAIIKPEHTSAAQRSRRWMLTRAEALVGFLLIFTMLLGGYLRFYGNNWDDFVHFHPDERFLTSFVGVQLDRGFLTFTDGDEAAQEAHCRAEYPDTSGVGPYFDARCSDMNPHNIGNGHFAYGTLPVFTAHWVATGLNQITSGDLNSINWKNSNNFTLLWRGLSALYDTITILLVFMIGLRLHGKWVGLLAAFIYAGAVLPIQIAHFATADGMTSMWVALTLLFVVRFQADGSWMDYAGSGLAFGAAMASRFNVAPLVVVIILAAVLRMIPAADNRMSWPERWRIFSLNFGGLVLAGVLTILAFRILNPYAFVGPGFFGIIPNGRWLEDVAHARFETSTANSAPPQWQWVGRTRYLFALQNMVLWGMGIAFGLAGWIAWAWSGWRLLRGRMGAMANMPLVVWILFYFALFGANFVMSMRYYLPLYSAFAVLTAWMLVELIKRAWKHRDAVSPLLRSLRRISAVGLLIFVAGFTMLWALMFTNVYRSMATFTQAGHWVWENVPGDFAMRIDGADEDTPLINIALANTSGPTNDVFALASRISNNFGVIHSFTPPVSGSVSSIYAPRIGTEPEMTVTVRPVNAEPLAEPIIDDHFRITPFSGAREVGTGEVTQIEAGQEYVIEYGVNFSTIVNGNFEIHLSNLAGIPSQSIVLPMPNDANNLRLTSERIINPEEPLLTRFIAPADSLISSLTLPPISEIRTGKAVGSLRLSISDPVNNEVLADATLTDQFIYDPDLVGLPYDIPLDQPIDLEAGKQYVFTAEVLRGAPIVTTGTVFAWEGAWVEPVPSSVCTLPIGTTLADNPPSGLRNSRECNGRNSSSTLLTTMQLDLYADDDEAKRVRMVDVLDTSDYLIIGSNRRYDSHSRIAIRWPLTMRYYDALFNGELGYELVEVFQESFELGPLQVSDQHLPIYDSPEWLNEFEAEEAFHVYDHPTGFIFRRTDDYSSERVREILYSVPLTPPEAAPRGFNDPTLVGPIDWNVENADQSPTSLMFSPDMWDIQQEGGTWADRFNRDSALNQNQLLGVIAWWLTLTLFGLAIWPLLFVAFPALADRGYAFARFSGVFVVAWLAWSGAAMRLATWNAEGIWVILAGMALISLIVAWRVRRKLFSYMRENARLLLTIEAISVILFLLMIGLRLTNPDLWTTGFGGEKPMNFAHFNGVLRSTIFPAIDPWFAEGYINYYYFGSVLVGTPTLALGIVPSFAYNLILPMLFSATGVAAFSAAFSIVNGLRRRETPEDAEAGPELDNEHSNGRNGWRRLGNPYVAGVVALLMAVFLGNLDTPRVFLNGVAQLGGYNNETWTGDFAFQQFIFQEYQEGNSGLPATDQAAADLMARVESNSFGDRLRFELAHFGDQLSSIGDGFGRLVQGESLPIGTDRWFWGPSRVIAESVGGGAITEMPAFTFIYADMHAHMISMPMMIFVVMFVFNELMLAGREQRRLLARVLALALGAITVGMFQATNTWDWPTFMILGVVGLGYAWWLSWREITRRSLVAMALYIGGFVVISYLAKLPYDTWFASIYNSVSLWEGRKTPLWAYLDIHGLFLFMVVSLLIWETARWLRSVRVRALRGQLRWLLLGFLAFVAVMAASILAAMLDYQAALIVMPLAAWILLLFFRPGQSIPMQFVLVIIGLALAITLGVEVVVLDGDSGRQNMVFKFYIQVWLLFSVASGAVVAWLLRSSEQWSGGLRTVWYVMGGALFFIAALFPVMGSMAKAQFRLADNIPLTLDGADFMEYATYWHKGQKVDMVADDNAIKWLQDNVEGSPVIMEAMGDPVLYSWGGRISIHTGLPSVVGWDHHQRQQRTLEDLSTLVDQRRANVNYFYTTESPEQAWRILQNFNVGYVVIAGLERARYAESPQGLAKFETMVERGWLERAYDEGNATIYRVVPEAGVSVAETSP